MLHLVIKRVWIERSLCTTHTLCEPEAPGLIEYDQENDVYRIRHEVLSRTRDELKLLLEASDVCPMDAFHIEVEDGRIFNVSGNEAVRAAVHAGRYSWSAESQGE